MFGCRLSRGSAVPHAAIAFVSDRAAEPPVFRDGNPICGRQVVFFLKLGIGDQSFPSPRGVDDEGAAEIGIDVDRGA
jgi:hypothetical protein